MKNKDEIKELFSDKLGNYEAKVNPDLWVNIASQIGTGSAIVSSGISLITKWVIGISSAAAIATGVVFIINNDSEIKKPIVITAIPIVKTEIIKDSIPSNNVIIQEKNQVIEVSQKEDPIIKRTPINNPNLQEDFQKRNLEPVLPFERKKQVVVNKEVKEVKKEEKPVEKKEEFKKPEEQISNLNSSVDLHLPNVFTPDNDGVNDSFFIESEGLSNFNIVILNSQNKIVFQSKSPSFTWEGYDLYGNISPNGKYLYYLTATDQEGKAIKKHSFLEVKR